MRFSTKHSLNPLLVVAFVGVIAFYAYYQSRAIIEGPSIVVETPRNGVTSTTSLISILGSVKHAREITLQGRPIFINLKGQFSEQLLLMDGYNIITLVAKDTEGRVEKKIIEVTYLHGMLE